jgi:peptide/nickel transport system substrate-binding protein
MTPYSGNRPTNLRNSFDGIMDLRGKSLDRRGLLRAGAIGIAALGPGLGRHALAQEATPAAGGFVPGTPEATLESGQVIRSVTREEYAKALFAQFPMSEPGQTGGQVLIGDSTDIGTVNGLLASDFPTAYITGLIFEALIGTSVIDGTIVPGLADSYEIAADGVTYTFTLNPNVTFHDGTPLTAEDVKFSFDMLFDPDMPIEYASSAAELLASYRIVDDLTFEMVSKYPSAVFLYNAAGATPVMPKHVWESIPAAEWAADPGSTGQDPSRVIGTGPYKFREWVPGDHVTLVPNPDYWDLVTGRVPSHDEWIFQILPDDLAAVEAVKNGETDILETVPAPQTEEVEAVEDVRVEIFPGFDFTYYAPNLRPERTPVFQDVEVRQALFIALNKQDIVDVIYAGFGEVAVGTQAPLSSAYDPTRFEEKYAFDPERARQLLESAGWVEGSDGVREKNGTRLAWTCILPESSTGEALATEFQQRWADIGAEMTPEIMPFPTLLERFDATDFDMALLGFSWGPTGDQGPMFSCEGGFNREGYCNPEYDALQEQQLGELDPEKRRELLIQQSLIVWRDLPVGIFRFAVGRTAVNERVQNYYVNDYSFIWSFPFVWIQE